MVEIDSMIHHRHHSASSHNHCIDKETEHTLDYLNLTTYAKVISIYITVQA